MEPLDSRTKSFSLSIIKLYGSLPQKVEAQIIGKQFLRSGTSVGAHYREAMHARSNSEFTAKIDAGLQELQETRYWLELLEEANIVAGKELDEICNEAKELTAILVSISKKVKAS